MTVSAVSSKGASLCIFFYVMLILYFNQTFVHLFLILPYCSPL
jgi:hypothetical protein